MTIHTAELVIKYKTKQTGLLGIFATTLFLSTALLFCLAPLSIKAILENTDSVPSVWSISLLFFITNMLIGFCYSHFTTHKLTINKQITIQVILLSLAILLFPKSIEQMRSFYDVTNPFHLILLLITTVSLPLFSLATTVPMVQHWYSDSLHPQAQDPYFLFVPVGLGGLTAVIFYPYFFSMNFNVLEQANLWLLFFVVFFILFSLCAITIKNVQHTKAQLHKYFARSNLQRNTEQITNNISFRQGLYWALLIFTPTSLLLSLATYTTINFGDVPYFGLMMLGLFLLAFSLGFSGRTTFEHPYSIIIQYGLLFLSVISYAFVYLFKHSWIFILIHSATFFFTTLVCVNELNKRRPTANYLTNFYLWVASGITLAIIFNKFFAPLLFSNIIEYPISLVFACLVRPQLGKLTKKIFLQGDVLIPLAILFLFYLLSASGVITANSTIESSMLIYFLLATIIFAFPERPLRLGLGVGSLLLSAMLFLNSNQSNVLFVERNFFGIVKIINSGNIHILLRNNIILGTQYFDYNNGEIAPYLKESQLSLCSSDANQSRLSMIAMSHLHDQSDINYYTPLKEILTTVRSKTKNPRVAIAGVGSGATACLAHSNEEFTFYERDNTLISLAMNRRYFTYFTDCAPKLLVHDNIYNGLLYSPNNYYDLIVFDNLIASLSPTHLITRKIIELNLEKLTPNGVLAFNISNRYFALKDFLSRIADSFHLVTRIRIDSHSNWQNYQLPSVWVVMAHRDSDLGEMDNNLDWQPLPPSSNQNFWQNSILI
jgi:spermidine synthase